MICSIDDCASKAVGRSFCPKHYYRFRRHGDPTVSLNDPKPCAVEGCERTHGGPTSTMCQLHTRRVREWGHPGTAELCHAPDGSGTTDSRGYRVRTIKGRQVREHRLVMEALLGRRLLRSEEVHHLNGDRADNRPENLELWSTSQPAGQRVADKVAWAKELLALYDPASLK